jgi:hypothetical protein
MNAEALFTAVLQLGAEWKVVRCEVDHAGQELTVHLDFGKRQREHHLTGLR